MKSKIESDLSYIERMLDRALLIPERIKQFAEAGFSIDDEIVLESISFNLAQIGEQLSSERLSKEIRKQYSSIEWKDIYGLRVLITHHYSNVQARKISDYLKRDLPKLTKDLSQIQSNLKQELSEFEDRIAC